MLWVLSFCLLGLKAFVIKFAGEHAELVERVYSRGIYPVISNLLTSISNIVPFSVGEIFIMFFIIGILIVLIKLIHFTIKRKFDKLILGISYVVFSIVLVTCIFDGVWLLNHYRTDIEDLMSLPIEKNNKEALVATFEALIIKTNSLRRELPEDSLSSKRDILHNAYRGYEELNKQYEFIKKDKVVVKGLLSSPIQTMSGYSGVYLFFIGEPTINIQAPIFTLPHTACHEIAHQKGFAEEQAANYIGFLACKNNEDLLFQYSGYFSAMEYVGSALLKEDSRLYYSLVKSIDGKVLEDSSYNWEFWEKAESQSASAVVNQLNDSYLKAYNQPDGIKSYGQFVDLLIADYMVDGEV
jgi:hypothetical protein